MQAPIGDLHIVPIVLPMAKGASTLFKVSPNRYRLHKRLASLAPSPKRPVPYPACRPLHHCPSDNSNGRLQNLNIDTSRRTLHPSRCLVFLSILYQLENPQSNTTKPQHFTIVLRARGSPSCFQSLRPKYRLSYDCNRAHITTHKKNIETQREKLSPSTY